MTGLTSVSPKLLGIPYSISNNVPRVGLYFAFPFFFALGMTREIGGVPIRSRAKALTASTLRNFFTLRFLAIADILP